jgi:FkbM family methyltransferase
MNLHAGRLILFRNTRRVRQTPKAFTNWSQLLGGLAAEKFGRGPEILHFKTRTGLEIDTPNHPGARVPVYEIFAEDAYQLQWFVGGLGGGTFNVLDIGGHVGTFSCQLASQYPKASVWVYEPSAKSAGFLRHNVETNDFSARIHVTQAAVSRSEGVAIFDDNDAGSGHNGLVAGKRRLIDEDHNHGSGRLVEVATVGLDDAIARAGGTIDLIKVDTEGAEYEMIYGSNPTSWESVKRLVLEYHDVEGQSWEELRTWLEKVGLNVVKQEPKTAGLGTAWLSREPLSATS